MGVGYRKLMVWQQSKSLAVQVYQLTAFDPWNKDWGLRDQVRRAAVSVPSNIAEGDARSSDKDSIRFFRIALGSLAELETQLEIAKEIGYLTSDQLAELLSRTEPLGASIGALIRSRKPSD
jgi:four helix bundle protein